MGTDSTRQTPLKITNVQLAFTGIEVTEVGQRKIEGFFRNGDSADGAGEAGPSTRTGQKRKADASPRSTVKGGKDDKGEETRAFICERCGKTISLAPKASGSLELDHDDQGDDSQTLSALMLEHDDYHFAQDLARSAGTFMEQQRHRGSNERAKSPMKPKKRKKEKETGKKDANKHDHGISRFLVRKVP